MTKEDTGHGIKVPVVRRTPCKQWAARGRLAALVSGTITLGLLLLIYLKCGSDRCALRQLMPKRVDTGVIMVDFAFSVHGVTCLPYIESSAGPKVDLTRQLFLFPFPSLPLFPGLLQLPVRRSPQNTWCCEYYGHNSLRRVGGRASCLDFRTRFEWPLLV